MKVINPPVIVRLQAGLGNQIYQYATGLALSKELNRKLYIDPKPIEGEAPVRRYMLNLFNIEENFVSGILKWCVRWDASIRMGKIFNILFPPSLFCKLIRDKELGFDKTIFNNHTGPIIIQGYWQSYKYFEKYSDQIRHQFTFKHEPDEENKTIITEIRSKNNPVSIHIRRGDYVSNPLANKIHGTCDLDYYKNAIKLIKQKVKDPFYYIFTDDPDWVRNNLSIPSQFKIIAHNLGKNDHEDLRLMTYCSHYIIANSSFSWWGAWLSQNRKNKIVIAPKKWFNLDNTPPADRIPNDWIRI